MKAVLYAGLVWLLAALTVLSILASSGSRRDVLQERSRPRVVDWSKKLRMDEEKLADLSFRRLGIISPAVKGSYQKYNQKLHKFLSEETRMFIRSQKKYMNALRQLEQAPQVVSEEIRDG